MSDAPSLLLNMGADVASATGMNPMQGQSAATGSQGNEFAGVLQSVLKPTPSSSQLPATVSPVPDKQLEANPLLFLQADGLANSLLAQADMPLDAELTGKSLPVEEPELALPTLLTEAEGQTPQVEFAAIDKPVSPLEELAVETNPSGNLAQQTNKPEAQERLNANAPTEATDVVLADTSTDSENKPAPVSSAGLAALQGQDMLPAVKPVTNSADDDLLSKITRSQSAISKPANPVSLDTRSVEAEVQEVSNQLFQEKLQSLVAHGKQDGLETASTMLDSIMADPKEHSALSKPASLSGITTYAAVAGTSSSLPAVSSTTPTIAQLTIPPQNPAWGDTVGDRVQWMAAQNIQEAKIRLHPQELGMLEVHIRMGSDQQTTISFSSPHAQVRDALESSIPRLREMFGETGVSLGDVNVSQHSSSQQGHADPDNKPASSAPSSHSHSAHELIDVAPPLSIMAQGNGMLDLYA